MELEQFKIIVDLLTEIKDLLKEDKQPHTKITVVGNKPQNSTKIPKGMQTNEDFTL